MTKKETSSQKEFLIPSSLSDIAKILGANPDALIMGGGIDIMNMRLESFSGAQSVISTTRVAELKKIFRNEYYIELGSAITISELMKTGKEHLAQILYEGFDELGPQSVKNWATIGGVLCTKEYRADCFVPLCAVGTEIELRSFYQDGRRKSQRWLPLGSFCRTDGSLDLQQGELMTRLRIPNEPWDLQYYCKMGTRYSTHGTILTLAIAARINKNTINEFSLYIGNGKSHIFTSELLAENLSGYNYPIKSSQIESANGLMTRFCQNMPKNFDPLTAYATKQTVLEFLLGMYE